jgi:hypothetical protein
MAAIEDGAYKNMFIFHVTGCYSNLCEGENDDDQCPPLMEDQQRRVL